MEYTKVLTHMYDALADRSDEVQEMESALAKIKRSTFSARSYADYPHSYDLEGMAHDVQDAIDTARDQLKNTTSAIDDMAEYIGEIRAIMEGRERDAGDYD